MNKNFVKTRLFFKSTQKLRPEGHFSDTPMAEIGDAGEFLLF